jgi:hypothetical protein
MAQPNARLEIDMEKLGAAMREILSLACHLRTMLDGSQARSTWLTTPPKVSSL